MTVIIQKLAYSIVLLMSLMCVTFAIGQRPRQSARDVAEDFETQVDTANREHNNEQVGLDFYIIGFPKCGSTSMMSTFEENDETSILHMKDRNAEYRLPNANDKMMEQLFIELKGMNLKSDQVKRGIKWPSGIIDVSSIKLLTKYNPPNKKTKLIVGLRHPVWWFQSYYNFRRKGAKIDPPPPESLTGSARPWDGVHTENARFEKYIVQLGKFDITKDELMSLAQNTRTKQIINTPYEVFFYDVGQLTDTNSERFSSFKETLASFLGLNTPLDIGNKNHVGGVDFVGKINICESKFNKIRAVLTKNGAESANWIRKHFANGTNVNLGGDEYFFDLVNSWGNDPCETINQPSN